jgi:hypothetical protein
MKNETTIQPTKLSYRHLSGKLYEVELNENITQEERTHEDTTETIYISDRYSNVVSVESKDDLIAGLIRLKYSVNDEYALLNKGIANAQNIEYIAYREYVEECKNLE